MKLRTFIIQVFVVSFVVSVFSQHVKYEDVYKHADDRLASIFRCVSFFLRLLSCLFVVFRKSVYCYFTALAVFVPRPCFCLFHSFSCFHTRCLPLRPWLSTHSVRADSHFKKSPRNTGDGHAWWRWIHIECVCVLVFLGMLEIVRASWTVITVNEPANHAWLNPSSKTLNASLSTAKCWKWHKPFSTSWTSKN